MSTSYRNLADKLRRQALDLLWRQWTSLGVPGNRSYQGDAILDPEALLLATTGLGRYDSRLMDLAIDWLDSGGGKRINLQRLKKLQGIVTLSDERVLGGMGEILSAQSSMRKWRSLHDDHYFVGEEEAEEAFLPMEGHPALPRTIDPDPRFKKFRLLRPVWSPRHACMPPPASRPENLLLTLRSFLGNTSRAEIMAWLLTHGPGTRSTIARDAGYGRETLQAPLAEMEDSGLVVADRLKGETLYRLRKHDWMGLFGFSATAGPLRWISWPWLYYYILRMTGLVEEMASSDVSVTLRAIEHRGFLDDAAPWLVRSPLRREMSAEREMKGDQLTGAILQDVELLGELMEGDFRTPSASGKV